MTLTYRTGTIGDLQEVKDLAVKSWAQFQSALTEEHWLKLQDTLSSDKLFTELLTKTNAIICATSDNNIVGMAFLVPEGNPTEIYNSDWCYIRFVSVDPDFAGQGIGKKLTAMCIDIARKNGETTIALHTSEMMDKARHIYEKAGFTILREIEPRLGKRYWLYTLAL